MIKMQKPANEKMANILSLSFLMKQLEISFDDVTPATTWLVVVFAFSLDTSIWHAVRFANREKKYSLKR